MPIAFYNKARTDGTLGAILSIVTQRAVLPTAGASLTTIPIPYLYRAVSRVPTAYAFFTIPTFAALTTRPFNLKPLLCV